MTGEAQSSAAEQSATGDSRMWYHDPFRLVQTNMRLPDILHDPARMARQAREFGATATVFNMGGIMAFYPTELELQVRNPFMEEGQDFVAAMIEAGRAEGLTMIGRFDLSKAMQPAYDAHPDWFVVTRTGEPLVYEGAYSACPNGGWGTEYGDLILQEALGKYDVDGVFFNMPGYPRTDYSGVNHGSCVCPNCRARFQEMYGLDLPELDGFEDPNWPQYLEFKAVTADELSQRNYDSIKAVRPDMAVMGWHPRNEVVRYETQRRVDRPAPEWAYQSGEQARTFLAKIPGSPMSSTSAAHIDYPWRQVLETSHYHIVRLAQQIANGAQPDLYLMGAFDDQDDTRFVEPVSDFFKWHARNQDHYSGLMPAARVALYDSNRTATYGGGVPGGSYWANAWRGAYTALVDQRVPFRVVNDARIADGTTQLSPEQYDAIILPNVAVMTGEEAAALDAYVEAGGLVIATGVTGAFGGIGAARERPAMASSPIASLAPGVSARGWTFDGATMQEVVFDPVRIAVDGDYYTPTLAEGARNLLCRAPDQRYGPPEFSFALADAVAGPEPGVLVRSYGKGTSIHIPWHPDEIYYRQGLPDQARLLTALIDHFAPPAPFRLEGGGPVEISVMQPREGKALVHLVNYSGQRNSLYAEPASIAGLRLGMRDGSQAQALVAGTALSAWGEDDDGYRWIDLPPLGAFEALHIS